MVGKKLQPQYLRLAAQEPDPFPAESPAKTYGDTEIVTTVFWLSFYILLTDWQ